jgi:UDP-N-acetylmuramoyl-L-alanyl-D-glutamate--2,6-diaminopimelate ligase
VAVFTNLSKEHIERHGSFENYRASKGKLFKENSNIHILNLDDKNVDYFLKFQAKKKIGFTLKENYKQKENIKIIQARILKEKDEKFEFQVNDTIFKLNLVGDFNVYNALASICIGLSQNIPLETSKKAIEKVKKVEGRMEIVIEKPFEVIVDYAHTPDSLEAVYKNLIQKKEEKENSRLICVLGAAGGGRDKWKRPKMGEIAGNYCDKIILTNEDPYDENPKEILNDIFSGIKKEQRKKVKKILDRKKAIKEALKLAKNNDIVIITGKGCEPWMCVKGGRKIPWDDREIVKEILKNEI